MTATLAEPLRVRWFGSIEFFWLWISQLISAFGDWVGLFAVTALAANISNRPEAATALAARFAIAPIFDFAHHGIVGNAMQVLPILTDTFREHIAMRSRKAA